MLFKGMLKWAVAREDCRTNESSTKSLSKRRKLLQLGSSHQQQQRNNNVEVNICRSNGENCETELIEGYKVTRTPNNNNNNTKSRHNNGNSSPRWNCKHRSSSLFPSTCNGSMRLIRPHVPHTNGDSTIHHHKTCTTCTANCTSNYNNDRESGSDSKSLLYMSLDQLPLAIVKQYERMLQENPGNNNNNNNIYKNINSNLKDSKAILPLPKNSSSLPIRTKSLENVSQIETTTTSNEIIRQAHNRQLTTKTSLLRTTSLASADMKKKTLTVKYFDIKYSNSLSCSSTTSSSSSSSGYRRINNGIANRGMEDRRDIPRKYLSFALSPIKSSTLPRSSSRKKSIVRINENANPVIADLPTGGIHNSRPPFKNIRNINIANMDTKNAIKSSLNPLHVPDSISHDVTDPQFLEKSVCFKPPPSAITRAVTPTIPSIRCAKKLTLKRSELRKLERIRNQTERLNKFLKKYYHDCLPNSPEEEDDHYNFGEKNISTSVLRTHWTENKLHEISQSFMLNNSSSSGSTTSGSSGSRSNSPLSRLICDIEGRAIRWRNLKNGCDFLPFQSFSNVSTTTLLPIIQEDTETSSILSDRIVPTIVEEFRDLKCDNLSYTTAQDNNSNKNVGIKDKGWGFLYESELDNNDGNVDVAKGILVTPPEFRKLEGNKREPFGDLFEKRPTLNHGIDSPLHPSFPSSSTSSSVMEHHYYEEDNIDEASIFVHANCSIDEEEINPKETISVLVVQGKCDTDTDHENANYPSENETWNSHEFSPCEINSLSSKEQHQQQSQITAPAARFDSTSIQLKTHNIDNIPFRSNHKAVEFNEEKGRLLQIERRRRQASITPRLDHGLAVSTPSRRRIIMKIKTKTPTRTPQKSKTPQKRLVTSPRKLVRKPHVTTAYTGKGEMLIRTYSNGDYVTLHVVQAKNLQTCYRSSWKLGIKISLLPEVNETSLTKFESIPVNPHRTCVKIDQKFSFEALSYRKVFFTLWKRLEKGRTLFLGWTTLDLELNKNTQSWFKLRKKKMSTSTCMYTAKSEQQHFNSCTSPCTNSTVTATTTVSTNNGFIPKKGKNISNKICTKEIVTLPPSEINEFENSHPSEMDVLKLLMNEPKQQVQTSSTMDSGVEDCCSCEPCEQQQQPGPPTMLPPPPPTTTMSNDSDLEEENYDDGLGPGFRVTVLMLKNENVGFGFSVVWVSPPIIERVEKNKTADIAGIHIGDLIIGVNGEDVSSTPNTTIYHKMKTTGNELELDLWRKYTPATNNSHPETSCTRDSNPIPINEIRPSLITNGYFCIKPPSSFSSSGSGYSSSHSNCNTMTSTKITTKTTLKNNHNHNNNTSSHCSQKFQPPPVSILRPPPPEPPNCSLPLPTQTSAQTTSTSSSWKIRFNIEVGHGTYV